MQFLQRWGEGNTKLFYANERNNNYLMLWSTNLQINFETIEGQDVTRCELQKSGKWTDWTKKNNP